MTVKKPLEAGMLCIINGKPSMCLQRTHGLSIFVLCDISPMMILVSTMLPRSTNLYRVVQAIYLPPQKTSFMWKSIKLMVLNGCTFYGSWTIAQRQVQTCFPLHVNSCNLGGEQDKKWPQEQQQGSNFQRQHHLWLPYSALWWLGSQSWIPLRNRSWKGPVSKCLH